MDFLLQIVRVLLLLQITLLQQMRLQQEFLFLVLPKDLNWLKV